MRSSRPRTKSNNKLYTAQVRSWRQTALEEMVLSSRCSLSERLAEAMHVSPVEHLTPDEYAAAKITEAIERMMH
jgi:hypothetical protein